MELEHLIVREAPRSRILSCTAGADVASLCTFFVTLQGSNLDHHSGDTKYDATPRKQRHVNDKAPTEGTHELSSPEQSPNNHTNRPREGQPDSK